MAYSSAYIIGPTYYGPVRTVFGPVTCGSLIRPVFRNLQGINNASEREFPDVPSLMPKSVSYFREY
jgi:hypothetical protein